MKNVLIILNNSDETAGYFETILNKINVSFFVIDLEKNEELPKEFNFSHIIIMGGEDSAYDKSDKILNELEFIKKAIDKNIPIFGVCLGMQLLAYALGCDVKRCEVGEYGFKNFACEIVADDLIFSGFNKSNFPVFQLHGDCVTLNDEVKLIAKGNSYQTQFIKYRDRFYGIQCHVEVEIDKLNVWFANNSELKKLDKNSELSKFISQKSEFEEIAEVIINNFINKIF